MSPFVILVILIIVILMFLCDCSIQLADQSFFVLYIYNYFFK